jgi:hypothetical protein
MYKFVNSTMLNLIRPICQYFQHRILANMNTTRYNKSKCKYRKSSFLSTVFVEYSWSMVLVCESLITLVN